MTYKIRAQAILKEETENRFAPLIHYLIYCLEHLLDTPFSLPTNGRKHHWTTRDRYTDRQRCMSKKPWGTSIFIVTVINYDLPCPIKI